MSTFICHNCGKENKVKQNTTNKYCSNACQGEHTAREVVEKWLKSESSDDFYGSSKQMRKTIRRYLIDRAGYKCSICGWDKLHPLDGKSTLEVDHINGDWLDCRISNLQVICPNCHSLTLDYKGRNKGRGRDYRRGV